MVKNVGYMIGQECRYKFIQLYDRPMGWHPAKIFLSVARPDNIFLIDKQERTVMEILNPEVIRFLYEHLYMAEINETFIELFTSIGRFKTVKYE